MNPVFAQAPRSVWLIAVVVSAGLVAAVALFADLHTITALVAQVPWWLIALGTSALMLEGVCTALRIKLLSRAPPSFRDCLAVTAWWVLGLAILPARLGELAGIHMLRQRLSHTLGEALSSLAVQRLFDVAIMFVAGAVTVALQTQLVGRTEAIVFSAIAAVVATFALWNLTAVFGVLAQGLRPWRRRRGVRLILRTLLQARGAAKRVLTRGRLAAIGLVSVTKWCINLSAIALLILALLPALGALQRVSVAILYNLAAIVPLQTVGGVGIGEVSIAAGVAWYGHGAVIAASSALLLRVALTGAPILFWLIVVVVDWTVDSNDQPRRER